MNYSLAILYFIIFSSIGLGGLVCCTSRPQATDHLEDIEGGLIPLPEPEYDLADVPDYNDLDVSPEKLTAPTRKRTGCRYELVFVGTITCKVTCYSQWDSPAEEKGIYANQNFADKLHKSERRIRRDHFTVALNYTMRQYHEALIKMPGDIWTHKFRFHIPGYNKQSPISHGTVLHRADSDYFSVPRDRMPNVRKYNIENRIDVLFTTADKYASIKQRQRYWKNPTISIDCYEIIKYAIYDDNSKKRIKQ